jgi:hypothetical protein
VHDRFWTRTDTPAAVSGRCFQRFSMLMWCCGLGGKGSVRTGAGKGKRVAFFPAGSHTRPLLKLRSAHPFVVKFDPFVICVRDFTFFARLLIGEWD